MKKLILILILFMATVAFAQDTNSFQVNPSADMVSRYVWRGIDFGASPTIQPDLGFTLKNLEFGAWGAFALNGSYQEVDLYCVYTFYKELFTIGFTDLFFPDASALNHQYFDLKNETTLHSVEFNASFNGTEKFPFYISFNTFVFGADKGVSDSSLNLVDSTYSYQFNNLYSSYIEVGYSLEQKDITLDFFLGYNLNGVDVEDAIIPSGEGFYLDGAGFTNIGITATKNINITNKFTLPIYGSFIVNPKRERVYLVFGLSL